MLPPESWEPAEVRVGRYHGAAMLQRNRRVLGVGDQLSGGRRPRGTVSRICPDGRDRDPRLRAVGRSTSEETNANDRSRVDGGSKILGLVTTRTKPDRTRTERANGSGPVARRVIQVAYSACSGMESSTCAYIRTFTSGSSISNQRLPCPKTGLVILCVERPRPVQVYSGTGMHTPDGHQLEGRRLRWLATLQSVIQRLGNEGADADAAGFGCPTHLFRKLVVKGDCGSHGALS